MTFVTCSQEHLMKNNCREQNSSKETEVDNASNIELSVDAGRLEVNGQSAAPLMETDGNIKNK